MERHSSNRFTLRGRVMLLATDGSPSAAGATRTAESIARRCDARVHVLVVLDSRPAPIPPPLDLAMQIAGESVGPGVHAEQERAIQRGLSSTLGHEVDWTVRLALGTPAAAIVHEARRLDAALIVMGLRRHSRADRVLHDETTLTVIRTSSCPVLGVAGNGDKLPGRILTAMDFTGASLSSSSVARSLAAPGARLTLAYVPTMLDDAEDGEGIIHRLGIEAGFERAERELAQDGITVDHVILHETRPRPVAERLLEYAEGAGVELITSGTGRPSRVDRWLLGSVSTDLIRDGRCSVLVAPPMLDATHWTRTIGGAGS